MHKEQTLKFVFSFVFFIQFPSLNEKIDGNNVGDGGYCNLNFIWNNISG